MPQPSEKNCICVQQNSYKQPVEHKYNWGKDHGKEKERKETETNAIVRRLEVSLGIHKSSITPLISFSIW